MKQSVGKCKYIIFWNLCALITSLAIGGYVFGSVGLSVCLSVCLFVDNITQNVMDGLG